MIRILFAVRDPMHCGVLDRSSVEAMEGFWRRTQAGITTPALAKVAAVETRPEIKKALAAPRPNRRREKTGQNPAETFLLPIASIELSHLFAFPPLARVPRPRRGSEAPV